MRLNPVVRVPGTAQSPLAEQSADVRIRATDDPAPQSLLHVRDRHAPLRIPAVKGLDAPSAVVCQLRSDDEIHRSEQHYIAQEEYACQYQNLGEVHPDVALPFDFDEGNSGCH